MFITYEHLLIKFNSNKIIKYLTFLYVVNIFLKNQSNLKNKKKIEKLYRYQHYIIIIIFILNFKKRKRYIYDIC